MTWGAYAEWVPPDPTARGPRYNSGGVRVFVTDGKTKTVIARVAWVRWRSKNPLRSFRHQFRSAIVRAELRAEQLNAEEDGVREQPGVEVVTS